MADEYTWGELKRDIRALLFPSGEADNLVVSHDKYFVDGIVNLQMVVDCLKQDNYDIVQACQTVYDCGMTVLDLPRGHIKSISIIDKINPDTKLEDADSPDDWCSEIAYREVDFCHISRYQKMCRSCCGLLPMGTFFGLPYCGFRPYPTPTDEGLPGGLPPLDLGMHYSQTSTNRSWGRAGGGVWAKDRSKIYIAPWLQTTESVIIKWDGIKRRWNDADLVDPDPMLSSALENYLRWQIALKEQEDYAQAKEFQDIFLVCRQDLHAECRRETMARFCESSVARQASTLGSNTNSLFYNDEQSASATCPEGTTGNAVNDVVPAGTVGSNISVADANAKALALAQANALAKLDCVTPPVTYWNTIQTAIATCSGDANHPPPSGDAATSTVPANTYSSTVSQEAADSAAYSRALSDARSKLVCTWYNKETSVTKECPNDNTITETVTIAASQYSSTLSQSDADSQAQTAANNAVNQALTDAGCAVGFFWNTAQFAQATLPCTQGGLHVTVTVNVTIPAHVVQGNTQASANQAAIALGQSYANSYAANKAALGQCGSYNVTLP